MRWIGSSDAYKAAVTRRAVAKNDFDAMLADCAARAAAVKAEPNQRPRRVAARLESLRVEYRSILRQRDYARTGVNAMHAGLDT